MMLLPILLQESRSCKLRALFSFQGAENRLNELEVARAQVAQIARELGIRASSGINVVENSAELYVLDLTQFDAALQKAGLQLPANVNVIKVNELPREVADIFGLSFGHKLGHLAWNLLLWQYQETGSLLSGGDHATNRYAPLYAPFV